MNVLCESEILDDLDFNKGPLKEEFDEAKGVIIICISNKNRQHNGQKID